MVTYSFGALPDYVGQEGEEECDYKTNRRSTTFPPTHLQVALTRDCADYILGRAVGNPKRFAHINREWNFITKTRPYLLDKDAIQVDFGPAVFSWLYNLQFSNLYPHLNISPWDRKQFLSVKFNVETQFKSIVKLVPDFDCGEIINPLLENRTLLIYKKIREDLDSVVQQSASMRKFNHKNSELTSEEIPFQIDLLGRMSLICSANITVLLYDGMRIVGNRDLLLLISDMVSERYLILLACSIASQFKEIQYPSVTDIIEVWNWGDELLKNHGIIAYKVIKSFEPIALSRLMTLEHDPLTNALDFQRELIEEAKDTIPGSENPLVDLINILNKHSNPHHVAQFFGLYRIWGHPYVDVREGVLQLRELSRKLKTIPVSLKTELEISFKETLCVQYRKKNGKWPNLEYSELLNSSYLKRIISSNDYLDLNSPEYEREDWMLISGLPTFSVDSSYNLAEMVADRALSHNRSVLRNWARHKKSIGPANTRRVITHWLKSDFVSVKVHLDNINNYGLKKDALVIGVTPKEREMKIKPRLFSLMTLEMRMFVVAIGSLISDYILPLFPAITMTDDLMTLTRKLHLMSKPVSKEDERISVIMNIDFEKWNSNMREELTHNCFLFLDQLFGYTNCISYLAKAFTQSEIYLANGSHIPVIDENLDFEPHPYNWHNHLGGLEGLNQKGWTLITVVLIGIVAKKHNVKYTLLGQGDNQVIKLSFQVPQGPSLSSSDKIIIIKEKLTRFRDDFTLFMREAGLPIKPSETWCSSRVFAYGKNLFFNGMPLSVSLKKICRMFPLSNDLFPTLENSISTVQSNAMAACQSDLTVMIPFIIANYETIYSLHLYATYSPLSRKPLHSVMRNSKGKWSVSVEPEKGRSHLIKKSPNLISNPFKNYILNPSDNTLTWELLCVLSLTPKILGGYPIQLLSSFIQRGFPDPVTESLSMIKLIISHSTSIIISKSLLNIGHPIFSPVCSPEMLIQDPVSLNLLIPSNSIGVIKGEVKKYLKDPQVVKNVYFSNFLALVEEEVDELCELLITTKPVWPRLLHDIFDATLPGFAQSVVNKIIKTSTLVSSAARQDAGIIETRLRLSEQLYFSAMFCRIEGNGVMWECSMKHGQTLRDQSWKSFSPIEGVSTPHPLEYMTAIPHGPMTCKKCESDQTGYVLIVFSPSIKHLGHSALERLGPARPYLGSSTREKIKRSSDIIIENIDPLLIRAMGVARVVGWMVEESDHLGIMITNLLSSLTNMNPNQFFSSSGTFSGAAEHRFKDYSTEHGGYIPTLFSLPTYVHISTNSFKEYSKGSENFTIHFQALMCAIQSSALISTSLFVKRNISSFHYHQTCPTCIQPVRDLIIQGDTRHSSYQFKTQKENPFCYVDISGINVSSRFTLNSRLATSFEDMSNNIKIQALLNIVGLELLSQSISVIRDSSESLRDSCNPRMAWARSLPPIKILETYSIMLLAHAIDFNSRSIIEKTGKFQEIILHGIETVSRGSLEVFYPISFIFGDPENRIELLCSDHNIIPPKGFPLCNKNLRSASMQAVIDVLNSLPVNLEKYPIVLNRYCPFQQLSFTTQLLSAIIVTPHLHDCWFTWLVINKLLMEYPPHEKSDLTEYILDLLTMKSHLMKKEIIEPQVAIKDWVTICENIEFVIINKTADRAVKEISSFNIKSELSVKSYLPHIKIGKELRSYVAWKVPNGPILEKKEPEILPTILIPDQKEMTHSLIHSYKPIPALTTAHYKYLEILDNMIAGDTRENGILVCGDGSGGIGALALRLNSRIKLLFNSLIDFEDIVEHSIPTCYPAALELLDVEDKCRIIQLQHMIEGITDITLPNFIDQILEASKRVELNYIICDAEGSGWNNPKKGLTLIENLCSIVCKLNHVEQLCFKTYLKNATLVWVQLTMLRGIFGSVRLIRSKFSNELGTEVFLHGIGRLDNPKLYQYTVNEKFEIIGPQPNSNVINWIRNDVCSCLSVIPLGMEELSDNVSQLLKSKLLNNQIKQDIFRRLSLVSFDAWMEKERHLRWGILNTRLVNSLISRFRSLKYIRRNQWQRRINVVLCRNIVYHITSLLISYCSRERLIGVILPELISDGLIIFYVTKGKLISFTVANKRKVLSTSEFMNIELQCYVIHIDSLFNKNHLKMLYQLVGQQKFLFHELSEPLEEVRFERTDLYYETILEDNKLSFYQSALDTPYNPELLDIISECSRFPES